MLETLVGIIQLYYDRAHHQDGAGSSTNTFLSKSRPVSSDQNNEVLIWRRSIVVGQVVTSKEQRRGGR